MRPKKPPEGCTTSMGKLLVTSMMHVDNRQLFTKASVRRRPARRVPFKPPTHIGWHNYPRICRGSRSSAIFNGALVKDMTAQCISANILDRLGGYASASTQRQLYSRGERCRTLVALHGRGPRPWKRILRDVCNHFLSRSSSCSGRTPQDILTLLLFTQRAISSFRVAACIVANAAG